MKTIEEQVEALTQELRPYPVGEEWYSFTPSLDPFINSGVITHSLLAQKSAPEHHRLYWILSEKSSTNKAEVEEYADCYRRLKLYQLLGKKAEKKFPIDWSIAAHSYIGTDFTQSSIGDVYSTALSSESQRYCVLGGVWFSREEDRLEALKICGIDRAFQEKCAKHGLGGA